MQRGEAAAPAGGPPRGARGGGGARSGQGGLRGRRRGRRRWERAGRRLSVSAGFSAPRWQCSPLGSLWRGAGSPCPASPRASGLRWGTGGEGPCAEPCCGGTWGRVAARGCCLFGTAGFPSFPAREAPGGAGGAEAPAVAGPLWAGAAPVGPEGVGTGADSYPAVTGRPVGAAGQCRCPLACSGDVAG